MIWAAKIILRSKSVIFDLSLKTRLQKLIQGFPVDCHPSSFCTFVCTLAAHLFHPALLFSRTTPPERAEHSSSRPTFLPFDSRVQPPPRSLWALAVYLGLLHAASPPLPSLLAEGLSRRGGVLRLVFNYLEKNKSSSGFPGLPPSLHCGVFTRR